MHKPGESHDHLSINEVYKIIMTFNQSEEIEIQKLAERFAADQLATGYLSRAYKTSLDRDLVKEMGKLGFIAPNLDHSHGGIKASGVVCGIICEALAYGDFNLAFVCMLHSLIGAILQQSASDEMIDETAHLLATGEALFALGLTEPEAGSDASSIRVTAVKKGEGFILNGEKSSISLAGDADYLILFSRLQSDRSKDNISCFLVPMKLKGIEVKKYDDIGCRPLCRGSIYFDNVVVPHRFLIGKEGKGLSEVLSGFDFSRGLIALMCVGAAQASINETWRYTKERQTFGQPILSYQGVSFPLAEHESLLSAVRSLSYDALARRDQGQAHTKEMAMVKWMGPKYSRDAIQDCLLVHGQYGYSKDLPHHQRMQDVMGLEIGDGMAQIMKLIIARESAGLLAMPNKVLRK